MLAFKLFLCLSILFGLTVAAPTPRKVAKRCAKRRTSSLLPSATVSSNNFAVSASSSAQAVASSSVSSSSSKSAEKSSSTQSSSQSGTSQALSALFPLGQDGKSWTTSDNAENSLSLSDDTFRPTNVMSSLSHDYVKAPDGQLAIEADYPKGSMNPANDPAGGFSFYAQGPEDVDLTTAKEVTLGYSIFFEEGFQWVKGGKIPGIFGGDSYDEAVGCSGGRRDDGCFSVRMMWRGNGAGELYTYLPPSFDANKKQCDVGPESDCNSVYGASVGRGAFSFKDGEWTTVTERVKLNDAGKANGEMELFANGKSVIKVDGLQIRDNDKGRFRGIQMQTFFGGSHDGFQAAVDSKAWFKDFSLAITETL